VAERGRVEVGTEFAVDPHQKVPVERGGYAPRVVIGRFQDREFLPQIDAEEQPATGADELCNAQSNSSASAGSKLPMVDPGKYTTRRAADTGGASNERVKSATTGYTLSPG